MPLPGGARAIGAGRQQRRDERVVGQRGPQAVVPGGRHQCESSCLLSSRPTDQRDHRATAKSEPLLQATPGIRASRSGNPLCASCLTCGDRNRPVVVTIFSVADRLRLRFVPDHTGCVPVKTMVVEVFEKTSMCDAFKKTMVEKTSHVSSDQQQAPRWSGRGPRPQAPRRPSSCRPSSGACVCVDAHGAHRRCCGFRCERLSIQGWRMLMYVDAISVCAVCSPRGRAHGQPPSSFPTQHV